MGFRGSEYYAEAPFTGEKAEDLGKNYVKSQTTNLGVRGSDPFGRAMFFNTSMQAG